MAGRHSGVAFGRESIGRSYDRVAATYAAGFVGELAGKPLDRALLAAFAEEVDGPVADLGAGPGHVGAHLTGLGLDVVAVDLSPAMSGIARRDQGVPAVVGSLTELPLAGGSLAGAVAFYCLIHLDDEGLDRVAAEVARALAPGAPLLVAFQVGEPGEPAHHVGQWRGHDVDFDFRRLDPAAVAARLDRAGLAVESTTVRAPYAEESDRRAYLLARKVRRVRG